jgi:prepilin-type N-terminal cleavage/methylation domain-containing protein
MVSCVLKTKRAFTLIELLIVVAIIGILAALAVPNFLNAQIRARIARAHGDMRALQLAIESYQADHGVYPPWSTPQNGPSVFGRDHPGIGCRFIRLTTPVAYINTIFPEAFSVQGVARAEGVDAKTDGEWYDTYEYATAQPWEQNPVSCSGAMYRLVSSGPDLIQAWGGTFLDAGLSGVNIYGVDYDASNGLTSIGDIVKVGGGPNDLPRKAFYDRTKGPGHL